MDWDNKISWDLSGKYARSIMMPLEPESLYKNKYLLQRGSKFSTSYVPPVHGSLAPMLWMRDKSLVQACGFSLIVASKPQLLLALWQKSC